MPFVLPDLVIESVLRDGFENARNNEAVVDDVFANLTRAFASSKYGQAELEKIKNLVQNREVSIIHSFNLAQTKMPTISIQLAEDTEDEEQARMSDLLSYESRPFTDPTRIANLVVVGSFTPLAYDSSTGEVKVPDSVDLSQVHANLLFVDSASVEHPIIGIIDNTIGNKRFFIDKGATVGLGAGAEIKSSIDFDQVKIKGNREDTALILGIHSKNALITKYLYILVKYFLLSRKDDICSRGLELSTYSGSDFTRNMEYGGDVIYSRYITIKGAVENEWDHSKVALIDNVEVTLLVEKDELGNEALDLTNSTVQVTED